VITAGGYREPITLQQIRTNMEMESHEENLHNMIKISKMETAKDQARDAARTIRDRQMRGGPTGIGGGQESPGGCLVFDASLGLNQHSANYLSVLLNKL
jgi:coatomer subunit delta